MGAANFEVKSWGRDPRHAFNNAVEDARYEHGHGGYTGTIAEKMGYELVDLPEGVAPEQVLDWVGDFDAANKTHPVEHDRLVYRCHKIWADKWGPALALRTGNTRHTLEVHGEDAHEYIFAGLASS